MDQGTLTPLLGIGVCVSIQFGAMEWSKRYFGQQNLIHGVGGPNGTILSGPQLVASGVFAGLANGVVSGPVEHIRIRKWTSDSTLSSPLIFVQDYRHNLLQNLYTPVHGMPLGRFMRSRVSPESTRVKA